MTGTSDTTWRESLAIVLTVLLLSYASALSGCRWGGFTGPGLCWTLDGQRHCVKVSRQ